MSKLPALRPLGCYSELPGRHICADIYDWKLACTFGALREPGTGLQITQREKEAIVILDLKGELVLSDDHLSLLQRLLCLLDFRRHKIILNLKEVSGIDASGLATLAFCARLFHDIDGRLVLLKPVQPHTQVADMELNTVLESYQDETEAVNSFFPVVPRYDILEFVKELEQLRARNSEVRKPGGGDESQDEVCHSNL